MTFGKMYLCLYECISIIYKVWYYVIILTVNCLNDNFFEAIKTVTFVYFVYSCIMFLSPIKQMLSHLISLLCYGYH